MMKLFNNVMKIVSAIFVSMLIFQSCENRVFNFDPKCKISNLVDGREYFPGEQILIKVDASDKEGQLSKVTLSVNSELVQTFSSEPYEYIWDSWGKTQGSYSIKAAATDKAGQEKDDAVNISLTHGLFYDALLYNMDYGYLDYYGKVSASGYRYYITLYSSTVVPQNYGNGVHINLFSSTNTVEGIYAFDAASTQTANTFDHLDYFINYHTDTHIGYNGVLKDGYLRISGSGSKYSVFFYGTNTFDKSIKCYFSGTLYYSDLSNKAR
jgi:hypothetical protein